MATTVIFGNKICKLPGSYARVVKSIPREAALASYNNFLLIDAGMGNGYNSIKGIKDNGKECIFSLTEEEANYYIKGGPLQPIVTALFHPADNKPGIGTLFLVKAATSTQAAATGSPVSLFSGKITASSLKTVEYGTICNTYPNGIAAVSDLKKGFVLICKYDSIVGKGWIEIWQGGYLGQNYGGEEINSDEVSSSPVMIWRSKKCANATVLVDYLKNPASGFGNYFEFADLTVVTASFGSADIDEMTKFSGGSDTYITSTSDFSDILNLTLDVDYSCMMVAETNQGTTLLPVTADHIINEAKGIKHLIIGAEEKADALLLASTYDNDQIICTSGQVINKSKFSPSGFINHDFLVTTAYVAGRIFGLTPEMPGTMKNLGIDGMVIEPSDVDLEDMLDGGVITPYYDSDLEYFALSQAVNSLQNNVAFINDDATTYSIQCKRILAQVVKNLVKNSKNDFWGSKEEDKAVNKGTLSDAYVKAWTETQLNRLSVAPNKTENNYLINYEVTKVETVDDNIFVYLAVTVNGEINKVFFLVTVLG